MFFLIYPVTLHFRGDILFFIKRARGSFTDYIKGIRAVIISEKPLILQIYGFPCHNKQIRHLASKCWPSGVFYNFIISVFIKGHGEGNRTPVRKPIHTNFSGCRMLFKFPKKTRQHSNRSFQYFPNTTAVRKKLPPVVHR